jgi:hypothetical protein
MPETEPPFTVRLSDPGDVAAALPHLIGFRPHESLVAISLRGSTRLRLGLTARVDLPPPEHHRPVLGGMVRCMVTDRPHAVLLVVVSEDGNVPGASGAADLPHRDLLHEALLSFDDARVPVREALLVRDGRWWSYDCDRACCAPGAGTPLRTDASPLAAAAVLAGQVVEADRAALVRRIAPVGFLAAAGMAAACDEVGDELARRTAQLGWDAVAD